MSRDFLKEEQVEAKRDGATVIKNSGRGIQKGDATLGPFTVDYKFSDKSFTFTKSVWAKICSDAQSNKLSIPVLKLIIGEKDSPKTKVWIIDDDTFHEMYDAWQASKEEDSSLGLRAPGFTKDK